MIGSSSSKLPLRFSLGEKPKFKNEWVLTARLIRSLIRVLSNMQAHSRAFLDLMRYRTTVSNGRALGGEKEFRRAKTLQHDTVCAQRVLRVGQSRCLRLHNVPCVISLVHVVCLSRLASVLESQKSIGHPCIHEPARVSIVNFDGRKEWSSSPSPSFTLNTAAALRGARRR